MTRVLIAFLILLFTSALSSAQVATTPAVAALVCAYNSSPPSLTPSGIFAYVQCDANGKLLTSGGGGGAVSSVTNVDGTLTISPTTGAVVASIANPIPIALTITPTQAANTSVPGLNLTNSTAASAGNQRFSPQTCWNGNGWGTTAPGSQATSFCVDDEPVQGAAAPTHNLTLSSQINGSGYTNLYSFSSGGQLTIPAGAFNLPSLQVGAGTMTGLWESSSALNISVAGNAFFSINNSSIDIAGNVFGISAGGTFASDVILSRKAAANWQFGNVDAAAPVAQTLSFQSVVAGTSNTAGVNTAIIGSLSTGSGASGDVIFKTGGTGAGATVQNSSVNALVIKGATQLVQLPAITNDSGLTDATLCEDTTVHGIHSGSGTLGICLGTSSERYKHGVTDLVAGLDDVMALQPKRYFLNADHGDPTKPYYGFLAEDGNRILPELTGLDNAGRPNTFDYLGLVPVLVRAIQQQQVEIEHLRARIH